MKYKVSFTQPFFSFGKVYNKALVIQKDARTLDAMDMLKTFMEDFRVVPAEHATDAYLMELYDSKFMLPIICLLFVLLICLT